MKQRNKAQGPSAALLLWAVLNLQEFLLETFMAGFPAFQPLHPCPPPSPTPWTRSHPSAASYPLDSCGLKEEPLAYG